MTTQITVRFPDWMIKDIIGETDNKSKRIKELVQKGAMVETLEDATGQSFKQIVRGRAKTSEKASHQDDPDGIRPQTCGDSFGQWSEFIYNNPWMAKTLGKTRS